MPTCSQYQVINSLERKRIRPNVSKNKDGRDITTTCSETEHHSPDSSHCASTVNGNIDTGHLNDQRQSVCAQETHEDGKTQDTIKKVNSFDATEFIVKLFYHDQNDPAGPTERQSSSILSSPTSETCDIPTCTDKTNSGEFKDLLYGLGFRALPGETVCQRDDLDTVFKKRPGIQRKPKKGEICEEEAVVIDGITTEPVQTVDINSLDPHLLRPTALCFDAIDVNVDHHEVKKALDKVLLHCEGGKVESIHYENRRLKKGNLPNRWMIYTDSPETRNSVYGRQLMFGDRSVVLRRYDDLVLLAHKKALRAAAWKSLLS